MTCIHYPDELVTTGTYSTDDQLCALLSNSTAQACAAMRRFVFATGHRQPLSLEAADRRYPIQFDAKAEAANRRPGYIKFHNRWGR